ncbi:hypothetical protein ACFO4E_08520 [Nocardiopsis mangrovi]|uniref:Bulb-type lectin domain-containing protein n=1 Tax=Nocardiopsis mangrovi TaxID=1179818 RepID=A0ABV9DWB7_9ACTN
MWSEVASGGSAVALNNSLVIDAASGEVLHEGEPLWGDGRSDDLIGDLSNGGSFGSGSYVVRRPQETPAGEANGPVRYHEVSWVVWATEGLLTFYGC